MPDCERHIKSKHSCSDALAQHLDKLPLKEQAALKARAEAKLGKRARGKSEDEERPQKAQREEERPAKKAKVTKSGGSDGKSPRSKGTAVEGNKP